MWQRLKTWLGFCQHHWVQQPTQLKYNFAFYRCSHCDKIIMKVDK